MYLHLFLSFYYLMKCLKLIVNKDSFYAEIYCRKKEIPIYLVHFFQYAYVCGGVPREEQACTRV